jgi:hypothetical protein
MTSDPLSLRRIKETTGSNGMSENRAALSQAANPSRGNLPWRAFMPVLMSRHVSGFMAIREKGQVAMRKALMVAAISGLTLVQSAEAQTDLSAYADSRGNLDVQKLTCAQLAGTWQQDADLLTAWYSGWYNGLARKHLLNIKRAKQAEHEVIQYCKANPNKRIIEAIAVVFKDMRARLGIKMKP